MPVTRWFYLSAFKSTPLFQFSDTQLYVAARPTEPNDQISALQSCLVSLQIWFCQNGMALNPDKSDAILICTVQHAHSDSNLISVNVAGTTVPLASNISIPGILQLYIFKRHSLTQRPITPGPQIQLLIFGALLIHLLTYMYMYLLTSPFSSSSSSFICSVNTSNNDSCSKKVYTSKTYQAHISTYGRLTTLSQKKRVNFETV